LKKQIPKLTKSRGQPQDLELDEAADDLAWAERAAYWEGATATRRPHPGQSRTRRRKKPEALILSGHGVRLQVEHGALVVQNGFTHYPQKREAWRLFPGQRNLPDRIVMLDGNGSLSFDVLAWLSEQRIPLVQINWQGEVITVLGGNPHAADIHLVEAQRYAADGPRGLEISLELIKQKIQGCQATLRSFAESLPRERALSKLEHALEELAFPTTSIESLRLIEGRAALAYFGFWQTLPLNWKGTGRKPIPEDWRRMGARVSAISGTNRNATHPVNAMLNYVYGMLESQVRIATVAAGLDPTLGFLHANRPGRVALVYDLMEPLRSHADRLLLEFVMSRKFSPGDFVVNEVGVCRLHPQLARAISTLAVDATAIESFLLRTLATLTSGSSQGEKLG